MKVEDYKFKIGDVVKVKARDDEDYYNNNYMEYWRPDKLYVIRWQPQKNGPKDIQNTYALISNYNEDEYIKGLFTSTHYERDIEKFEGKIDKNSPIGFLQEIIKNEIIVSREIWTKLKIGEILLDEKGEYKNLNEFKEGDNWRLYSNMLNKEFTKLPADLFISFEKFCTPIKDFIAKARIHSTNNYEEDFYISIEEKPKVIIGKNILEENELNVICKFISDNLDVLMEYWNSNAEMDIIDLYEKLNIHIQKKSD